MTPKVSICMPTYNQARFLPEAIESVLGVSGDTVKGRLARARKQIQVHLEKEGFRREQ